MCLKCIVLLYTLDIAILHQRELCLVTLFIMFKPDLLGSSFKLSSSNVPYFRGSNASLVWGTSVPLMHHWCGYLYSNFFSNTQCLSISIFQLLFIKSSFNVLCLLKENHVAIHHPIFSFLLKSYFVHFNVSD